MRRFSCMVFFLIYPAGLNPLCAFSQTSPPPLLAAAWDTPAATEVPGEFQRLELLAPYWSEISTKILPTSASRPSPSQTAAAQTSQDFNSSRAETHISQGQIQAQVPLATEDVLKTLPGADLQSRGPLGIQNDLAVGGSTYSQTLLLLDNMPLRDPQTGHNRLDLPLPPCELEYADLLPGHASARFGSEAFGGTVALAAKPAGQGAGELETFGGDFGTYGGQLRVPFCVENIGQTLSMNRVTTAGFRPDTGADIFQAGYAAQGDLPELPWKLRLGYADKNFGAQDFYATYPSWEHTRTEFAAAQARYSLAPEVALLPQFSFRRHEDFFLLDVYHPGAYANQHLSWVDSLEMPALCTLPDGSQLRLGLEGCQENLNSSNLGVRVRTLGSGYAFFQSNTRNNWTYDAGLRLDSWDQNQTAWSPSLGAAYGISENWKLRASVGQAFRLPDFTELYYADPGNVGNPSLAPEKAWVYEAGLDGRPATNWQNQLTFFRRDEFDVIDWTRTAGSDPWRAGNISRVEVTGATALARWAHAGWDARADYSFLSLRSGLNESLQSKYQFNYPAHQLQIQLLYAAGSVQPWLRLAYVQRLQAAGSWLLDAAVRWRLLPQTTIFAKGTNCLNVGYEDIPGVPQPGRWLLGGAEINF
jgi:iron complex outermembrane receptor protein